MFPIQDLKLKRLAERKSDLNLKTLKTLNSDIPIYKNKNLDIIIAAIKNARNKNKPVILALGAHVLRQGNGCYLNDLIKKGYVTHIATNMAFAIHDYELAYQGETTESVEYYLSEGQFGLWKELKYFNSFIEIFKQNGLGETIGYVHKKCLPNNGINYESVLKTALDYKCPFTIHVNLGFDILAEIPNYNPELFGRLSYNDFLTFTDSISKLNNGGVFINAGSAIMGTEIFIKALSMARNIAHQKNEVIDDFIIGVFDVIPLDEKPPDKTNWQYYCRFNKTLLHRITKQAYYVQGKIQKTFPNLWKGIIQ